MCQLTSAGMTLLRIARPFHLLSPTHAPTFFAHVYALDRPLLLGHAPKATINAQVSWCILNIEKD